MINNIPKSFYDKLKNWLGKDGIEFFKNCYETTGTVSPILNTQTIPHPVHFREGMAVRNYLRKQPECKDWTDHDFDNNWEKIIEKVIK